MVGYLGAMLLGASLLAIGSFISSLTESQLIAFVIGFGASVDALGARVYRARLG